MNISFQKAQPNHAGLSAQLEHENSKLPPNQHTLSLHHATPTHPTSPIPTGPGDGACGRAALIIHQLPRKITLDSLPKTNSISP